MNNPSAKRYTAEEMEVRAQILDKAHEMPVAAAMIRQGIRTESYVQALVESLRKIREQGRRYHSTEHLALIAAEALSNLDAKERGG